MVADHCRPLRDQLENGGPIGEVSYSGYITTPRALLLIRDVLLDPVRGKRADSETVLRVFTQELRRDVRPIHGGQAHESRSSWKRSERAAVASGGRGRSSLKPAPRPTSASFGDWADGVAWTPKLDQGAGCWRCRPSVDFPFEGTSFRQMQAFNQVTKRCRVASQGTHPTYIYVATA